MNTYVIQRFKVMKVLPTSKCSASGFVDIGAGIYIQIDLDPVGVDFLRQLARIPA